MYRQCWWTAFWTGIVITWYSYCLNGCQLQCALLFMCRYVISRVWITLGLHVISPVRFHLDRICSCRVSLDYPAFTRDQSSSVPFGSDLLLNQLAWITLRLHVISPVRFHLDRICSCKGYPGLRWVYTCIVLPGNHVVPNWITFVCEPVCWEELIRNGSTRFTKPPLLWGVFLLILIPVCQ